MSKKLPEQFYLRQNVVQVSKDLLGKVLCTKIDNVLTSGIIIETEAYEGITDKASHAYGDRRTNRTETMYCQGGLSYVYLCYGIHQLFNVITNTKDIPHAVLIRGIKPIEGIETILQRRKQHKLTKNICVGPGKVSQALGITTQLNGTNLSGNKIWIEDQGIKISPDKIVASPRVGVDYAGDHALWHYRFQIEL